MTTETLKRISVKKENPVITVSHWFLNDKFSNTLKHNMEPFSEIPRVLIE